MNNISSFDEFSRGSGKARPSLNFSIPTGETISKQTETASPELETPEKPARFSRALQRINAVDESGERDSFKDCYDVVHAEHQHLLKEINRIEYGDPEMKKHVTELKKAFNDLIVKLQFFSEKGAKK